MKRRLAYTLETLPGIVFLIALIIAALLNFPFSKQGIVEIFIIVLGVLLGFWSVTFPAKIPKEAAKKSEESRAFRTGRFWIAYILVWCIVTSVVAYLFLEVHWGMIFVSAFAFYMGLCMFLWGCLIELDIVE